MRMTRFVAALVIACCLPGLLAADVRAAENAALALSRQARAILSDKCFTCHGPDEKARQGELRLDHRESAAGVLKFSSKSEGKLITRIISTDDDVRMPPPDSKLVLTKREIETLTRWVKSGAIYEKHWSFRPISAATVPNVKRKAWPTNSIDRFILSRIESSGLKPAPRAGREKQIRRLSFDLTGLPPTLAEIDVFVADDSKDAYEKVVDGLLKSPAYGERMAAHWLDVARYSDTYGYQVDRDRYVWPYRDWVVRAYNRNLSYDKFVTAQLAGDLLPNATDDQILATTFNRLHPQKVEGGSVPEEFRVEYVADRNHTFATAFLGLTLECCRCHDHKYDPIAQKEYYQFFAYFNNIDESGMYSYFTQSVPTPTMLHIDDKTKKRIADIERAIATQQRKLADIRKQRVSAFNEWLNNRPQPAATPGRVAHLDFEKTGIGANRRIDGPTGKAVQLTGDDAVGLKVGNFTRNQPFSVAFRMYTPDVKKRAVVFHRSRAWTDAGSRGYELLIEDGKLSAALIHFWPGNAIRVKTRQPIPVAKWLHVTITYDGSSRAKGLEMFIDGQQADTEVDHDNLTKNITGGGGNNIAIGQRFRDRGFTNGLIDEFQVFNRQLTPLELATINDGVSLEAALKTPVAKLTVRQKQRLFDTYLSAVDAVVLKERQQLRKLRDQRSKTVDGLREIMVMRELGRTRPTHLLTRGEYDKPGQRVFPNTPTVFPRFDKSAPANRLGLAQWLMHPDHPLTARVAVNRYWQLMFGRGLVRTPEDFGSQGAPPTHPLLLDWLARDFIQSDWDVKRLVKTLVMTSVYRQTSRLPDARAQQNLLKRDPTNRLLARAPSYRLSAEMLRDNVLAVSGLLVRKTGGPPVRPYELEASFKPVRKDRGAGLYRRSVYTYWKRTAPAPLLMTLNASKRDVCRVKRGRTSSPLQPLVMLNSPQFVEAARVLAETLLKKHGDDTTAILIELFRRLTSRKPTATELKVLGDLYARQSKHYAANTNQATAFLKIGETKYDPKLPAARLAAIGVVANTLVNFDECVTKR